jgi:phospholipid-translocating ATPase
MHPISSEEIKTGDLILVKKEQRVPADMVLIYSYDKEGQAFVKTDQIDGETDWKSRESI